MECSPYPPPKKNGYNIQILTMANMIYYTVILQYLQHWLQQPLFLPSIGIPGDASHFFFK